MIVDDFRTGRREFIADAAAPRPERGCSSRATCSTKRPRATRSTAATGSSICRPTPTCATASSIRSATSSRTRLRPRRVLEAMRARRRQADRLLLDRLGLRRAGGVPDARGCAVPDPDLAVRRLEARRRGPDRRLLPRLSASPASICRFVSILGERYTHGHVFDFYRALQRDPTRLQRARATAARRSPTSTSRTASARSSRAAAAPRERAGSAHLQPRHR